MTTLINRDLKHIWHPCSQMKDYESLAPIEIQAAKGSKLILQNGDRIIDAISSWWCKSLGHGHPRLKKALQKQSELFEHVILANTTNSLIVELSERLCEMTRMDKVFYAGDGSMAVEIAVKMSLHARKIKGESKRRKFMALENGYHGETIMTLALGDLGIYKADYEDLMPDVDYIKNIPYVSSKNDALWSDCSEYWQKIEAQLNQRKDELTAIILEPILQAAGGMLIYSQDFLRRLRKWTKENNVHLIADEIMTGFGRTALALASEHAEIQADFICLSKGLTAGWMAMSAMLTSNEIYDLFYDDYTKQKSFLHSNTYAGNALAAAVALEAFSIYEEEGIYQQVQENEAFLYDLMKTVETETSCLKNSRHIGALVAADLDLSKENESKRFGFELYKIAIKNGILLRPLGNSIYWLPPLNTKRETLEELAEKTIISLNELRNVKQFH